MISANAKCGKWLTTTAGKAMVNELWLTQIFHREREKSNAKRAEEEKERKEEKEKKRQEKS